MGTSCFIGIKKNNGSIEAISCHWDGYPSGVGVTLLHHYNNEEVITSLMALGSISSLGERLAPEPGEHHSFYEPVDDITVAYCRDRGDRLIIYHYPSIERFKSGAECYDYVYLFKDNAWWYAESGSALTKLIEERVLQ